MTFIAKVISNFNNVYDTLNFLQSIAGESVDSSLEKMITYVKKNGVKERDRQTEVEIRDTTQCDQ